MIAPQELRIGNYIRDIESEREGFVLTIGKRTSTVKMEFSELTQKFEEFEPIELTEDWLLKLGFDLLHKGKFRNVYDYSLDHRFGYSDNHGLVNVDSVLTFVGNSFSHIKYVHQLQNLYFALTGEELKIKES